MLSGWRSVWSARRLFCESSSGGLLTLCEEVLRGADEIMVLIGEAFDAKSCCECSFGECGEIDMGRDILFARIFQGSRVAAMSTITTEGAVRSMRSEQFEAREPVVDDEDEALVHALRKSVNPVAGGGAKLGNCPCRAWG